MKPFPEKNKLEVIKREFKIEQMELRSLPVFFKFNMPLLFIERRQSACKYVPFCNGKQWHHGHSAGARGENNFIRIYETLY